ncbi:unnamed protein product [Adineta steineri]|uniref:G-protein coupled receptors family 1 profile domain-containing protein n=2 Tax=Adineta steineri TaxID=433720 RepID=A0A818W5Y2_9BILA|nr:unnamed protein product [Adineta steineri]
MTFNQTGFILNIITFGIDLITYLNSLIIFIWIIFHIYFNRIKQDDRITIMHCMAIYLLLLIYTAILILSNIQTLLGDLYSYNFDSSWCIFLGYFSPVVLTTLYWCFAFYRFCRVVYSPYRWLQYIWVYIIMVPIEFLLICILFYPILYWHDVVYIPNEHYCYVPYTHFRGILWLAFNCYGIPTTSLSLIYLRITIYLRQQTNNQILAIKQRQDRDLLVIRRILITIGLLLALGIPGVVFLVMLRITGEEYPLLLRIEWVFVSLSMIGLSISTVFFTSQLKQIIFKKFKNNRIIVIQNEAIARTIPMNDM